MIRATRVRGKCQRRYYDKAATRRTVIVQKERGIVPVDHLARAYLEKVGKCISIKDPFIGPLGTLGGGQAVQTHGWKPNCCFIRNCSGEFWAALIGAKGG